MLLTAPPPTAAARIGGRPLRPLLATVAALGGCVAVNLVDPNEPGALGLCPFTALTGLDCPGCGTLRATRALTRGDLLRAADHNLLFVLLVPLLLWGLVAWWRHERGRRAATPRVPTALATAVAVAVPGWWVARNLPWFAWLGSAAG